MLVGRRSFGKLVAVSGLASVAATTSTETTVRPQSKPLPFDLPSTNRLRSSPRKVFAHYFTPFPLSLDNKPAGLDYYASHYINPVGEKGIHAAYGGYIRERPIPLRVSKSASWQFDNLKIEVRRASDAGIDGFIVDVLATSGDLWDRLILLMHAAAEVDVDFKIVPMPDSQVPSIGEPVSLANAIASIANHSSIFRLPDGRLLISPFFPERLGAAWWDNWMNIMRVRHNIEVALLPCFLDYPRNVDAFEPISYGYANWGARNPAANAYSAAHINDAHGRGKLWMQPVSAQDVRPSQGVYDEANNSRNLRVTWEGAIAGADWVQIITWNDYSEGTEFSPSTHIGWSPLDISSYYLTKFKTGEWPLIERDVIHLSHRIQFAAARPTDQPMLMTLREGSSPARDEVEVLAFLKRKAIVEVTTGNTVQSYLAREGMSVWNTGLKPGETAVIVRRAGRVVASVRSPHVGTADPAVQDLQYHFTSNAPRRFGYY